MSQGRPVGMSAKQWLEENGIKEKAYYYWLRKFRREAYNQTQLPT
ncbi:IS66 family insertion sequence element accessory protein TnpB, partial [Lachnospiraceae bacterium BSM-380-WT-5A]|nr:IS66 family insertion sequence element accessory protein TnpB [Oliverpabstia intestinalis]